MWACVGVMTRALYLSCRRHRAHYHSLCMLITSAATLRRSAAVFSPSCARYYSLLAEGKKKRAYGYVAQLFDGTDLTDVSRLAEESFKLNVEQLVSGILRGKQCLVAPYYISINIALS